jgi:hypothetical protein
MGVVGEVLLAKHCHYPATRGSEFLVRSKECWHSIVHMLRRDRQDTLAGTPHGMRLESQRQFLSHSSIWIEESVRDDFGSTR